MNRLAAVVWGLAVVIIGYCAAVIALGPKADASGWLLALAFAGAAGYCAWQAWQEWKPPRDLFAPAEPVQPQTEMTDFPGAWRGDPIPLEAQIDALAQAGLTMAPGRTIEELLGSWPRANYEADPYGLILFMYGSDVEHAPWQRAFCERGWNFDMECLVTAGDYVRVFEQIVRITGQPNLATGMSDNFRLEAPACQIKYTIDGRERVLSARVDNDWADYEAVAAFARDVEEEIGDGRHFWASDNGQASILFFVTDAEAAAINALREGVLERYAGALGG